MQSLFDTILAEAELLLDLPDAARAEAWVSGAFGEWRQPGTAGDLTAVDADFLEYLSAVGGPAALAVAVAATGLGDRALADGARAVVATLSTATSLPSWGPAVGSSQPIRALSVTRGDAESIVIEFEDDGSGHALLVEIDHAHNGAAVDARFGSGELIDAVATEELGLEFEVLEPDIARARVRESLDRADATPEAEPSDELIMNRLLVQARVDARPGASRPAAAAAGMREPDPDGDAAAVELLRGALRQRLGDDPPQPDLDEAVAALAQLVADGEPDAMAAVAAAGDADPVAVAGAYVAPLSLSGFTRSEQQAVLDLEWADWLGVVIQLVRAGSGADASPGALVQGINRCPEVTTTIPKKHAPAVAHAFGLTMHAWVLAGVIDDDDRLTPLGAWLLPRALARAWGGSF